MPRLRLTVYLLLLLTLGANLAWAEQRFPPPDFESGYVMPTMENPPARGLSFQYLDVLVLVGALALASYLMLKQRSRKAVIALSLFSLLYFGFYRLGCVCAIGSVQNVALALGDRSYAIPLTVLVFFAAPLFFALFFGRAFCAGVCPQGALQDLVLWRPLTLPRWLEQALGLIPYLFLGVGVLLAVTSSTFLICRWDPWVPLFRFSGGFAILIAGLAFVGVAMFVGRPYCRFACPYGVLLKWAGSVSRWRVRITPDDCTQCRLCETSCPFGAIRLPADPELRPAQLSQERKRFVALVVAIPLLGALGGWLGFALSGSAATTSPTIQLADLYLAQQETNAPALSTVDQVAFERAQRNVDELLPAAVRVRRQFAVGTTILGAWLGLLIGFKLVRPSVLPRRQDYEPDPGKCYGCARCFRQCPQERLRLGLPVGDLALGPPSPAQLNPTNKTQTSTTAKPLSPQAD